MANNTLNVLLLGETGVGKSTLINALLNYFTYDNLKQAAKQKLRYFVPTKFTVSDDQYQQKIVCVGCNPNENQIIAASATQKPNIYLLKLPHFTLRIIDTPGMADTRGMRYDKTNTDKLMQCISQLKYLNAICVVLKPDVSRLNAQFEYCFNQILASLDRGVQNNIIFIFTHARSNLGDAISLLNHSLGRIKNMTIRSNSENTFHTENDPFRYLAAISCGLIFDEQQVHIYERSWDDSSKECQRLVNYISELRPIPMQGTITINEARRIVANLAQPIAEMLVLYDKAIDRLQEHELVLKESQNTVAKLRDNLYIPVTKYQITQIVRTTVESQTGSWNTGLSFSFRPPFASFNIGYDQSRTSQTHTQEILEPVEFIIEDVSIRAQLEHSQNTAAVAASKINEINNLIDEYGTEAEMILNAAVQFSVFLEENAIVSYGDLFLMYFEHLLQRERDKRVDADKKKLKHLENVLIKYRERKKNVSRVSAAEILNTIDQLMDLEHVGEQLRHFRDRTYALEDSQYNTLDNRR